MDDSYIFSVCEKFLDYLGNDEDTFPSSASRLLGMALFSDEPWVRGKAVRKMERIMQDAEKRAHQERGVFERPDSLREWMEQLVQAWGEEEDAKIMGHKHEWRTRYFYTFRHDYASGMYCKCGAELDLGDVENAINVLEDIACDPCLSPDANAARARQALQGVT